jgi:hypothetical protein
LDTPQQAQAAMQTLDDALDVVTSCAAASGPRSTASTRSSPAWPPRSPARPRGRTLASAWPRLRNSQARMLRQPSEAVTAQGRPFPAGVLDLLRWDASEIVWGADGGALARAS